MSRRPDNPWAFFESCGIEKTSEGHDVATLAGVFEAGADALEEMLKADGQKVEKGDTIRFLRNHPGIGMKQYYAFTFEAPNIVCSIPEEAGE